MGALIGGGFAVVGMFVTERRDRRKTQEDRQHAALHAVLSRLAALRHLYMTDVEPNGYDLTPQGEVQQRRILDELRTQVGLLDRAELRVELDFVELAIGNGALMSFAGHRDALVTARMTGYGEAVVQAALRNEPLPTPPEFVRVYRGAVEDYEAAMVEMYKDMEEERGLEQERERQMADPEPPEPPGDSRSNRT
jgi:hypothetical protein